MASTKKFFSLVAAGALVGCLALAGCASNQSEPDTASDTAAATDSAPAIAGNWKVNGEVLAVNLSEEEKTIFDKAAADIDDMAYEPVAVLGSQVVAGMNYAYLCKAQSKEAKEPSWQVVTVYNDLEGNAEITTANEIVLSDIKVATGSNASEAVGGWTVPNPNNGMIIPSAAQTAYSKAMEGYTGVAAAPVELLGTQAAEGTNYLILCEGASATAEPINTIYVATVHDDPSGKSQITSMDPLNLIYYVTPQTEN